MALATCMKAIIGPDGELIGFEFDNSAATARPEKGKSLLDFPEEYCVVDLETTGLSPLFDSIIEVAAVKYSHGKECGRFQSLTNPRATISRGDGDSDDDSDEGRIVSEFIEQLTGITNEMLKDAPSNSEVLKAFDEFVGDSVIVGYNVNFDVNFLYDNYQDHLGKPFKNNFVDVMRFSRRLYPELESHRLIDTATALKVAQGVTHRALDDALVTAQCFQRIHEEVQSKYGDLKTFLKKIRKPDLRAADIHGDASKVNVDSPLYGRRCVFTGKLEKFPRREAMQIVADLGGINEDGVTKHTNFLILGSTDYNASLKGAKSSKHLKAEKYIAAGKDLTILPEAVFYEMIQDSLKSAIDETCDADDIA